MDKTITRIENHSNPLGLQQKSKRWSWNPGRREYDIINEWKKCIEFQGISK